MKQRGEQLSFLDTRNFKRYKKYHGLKSDTIDKARLLFIMEDSSTCLYISVILDIPEHIALLASSVIQLPCIVCTGQLPAAAGRTSHSLAVEIGNLTFISAVWLPKVRT